MTELDEKIDKIAKDCADCTEHPLSNALIIKDAIYAGIRAFAEQEPSDKMIGNMMDNVGTIRSPETYLAFKYSLGKVMAEAVKSLPTGQ